MNPASKSKASARTLVLAGAILTLGGCAFGQKVGYSNTTADIKASGDKSVALATWDQRSYVVRGNKNPSFVGLSRGGFGNPFDVNTQSGAPLADDFSQSLRQSLNARGFKTVVVTTQAKQNRGEVTAALRAEKAERAALVTITEWKTDTYMRTSLNYDVNLTVLGADGKELANQSFTFDSTIENVGAAYKRAIEEWFSAPAIVDALK